MLVRNFEKQFFGSSGDFLGRTEPISIFGMIIFAIIVIAVLWCFIVLGVMLPG